MSIKLLETHIVLRLASNPWRELDVCQRQQNFQVYLCNIDRIIIIIKISLMRKSIHAKKQKKQRFNSLNSTSIQKTAHFNDDPQPQYAARNSLSNSLAPSLHFNENRDFYNFNSTKIMKQEINTMQTRIKNPSNKSQNLSTDFQGNTIKSIAKFCLNLLASKRISEKDCGLLEQKLQTLISEKVKATTEHYLEQYARKSIQKLLQSHFIMQKTNGINENQIKNRLITIESGYSHIIQTYDNFLAIIQQMRDKQANREKKASKVDLTQFLTQTQNEMGQIQVKINELAGELSKLKKSQFQEFSSLKVQPKPLKENDIFYITEGFLQDGPNIPKVASKQKDERIKQFAFMT